MSNINLTRNDSSNSIERENKIVVTSGKENEISLTTQYHTSEIEQNRILVKNAIWMIWVGISLIYIATLNAMEKDSMFTLVTGVSGVLIDLFSATIILLANRSSETKQKYFENLSAMEHEKEIMKFVSDTDKDNEFQCKMVSKIVEKHCSDNKNT